MRALRRTSISAAFGVALAAALTARAPEPPADAPWPVVIRADNNGEPQPPTGLAVRRTGDGRVALRWTPPATGPVPTGYMLEGGYTPGEVLGQVPLGEAPEAELTLPDGVYYLRIRSIASGEVSEASTELRAVAGAAMPPSAPAGVTALVRDRSLTLAWTPTYDGGSANAYWLLVDGSLSGSLPLPPGDTATFANVPLGRYTLRVVAVNEAGLSTPSAPVTVDLPQACSGAPGPVHDIRSWRDGSTLTLEWSPPAEGAAATRYAVTLGGAVSMRLETTARRLSGPAPAGHYTTQIVALNDCGAGPATPPAVEWTTVVPTGDGHEPHFEPVPGHTTHRVFWSTSRADLEALAPTVAAMDVSTSPAPVPATVSDAPIYYRVAAAHGTVSGPPGPVAIAPVLELTHYTGWFANVTPALFDLNGDGCLDLLGAWGRCDGTFDRQATVGFDAHVAAGTRARDVRWADFTGDGIVDAFTNVYARADDTTVRAGLLVGLGDGTFREDAGVAALGIRGYGETILAADFDNDGDLDIFLPHYTQLDDGGRNWLLVNDGTGRFHDVATAAGVALNPHFQPEGAQAIDVNDDGWIDILVASQLFLNNGNLTFTDAAAAWRLPIDFDEGLQLFDADLDGDLDLVHHDTRVTRLYRNQDERFGPAEILAGTPESNTFGFGVNVCDLNGDGYEDLLVANNHRVSTVGLPRVLLNLGGHFKESAVLRAPASYNDLLACVDLDGSGLPDVINRWADSAPATPGTGGFRIYRSLGTGSAAIRLRVLGAAGQHNQQGRVVRLRPRSQPSKTLRRAVEAGSGLMAQNGYDLQVAAPWPGEYDVEVRYAHGWVRATARPGDVLTIRADGTVVPGLQ